MNDELEFIYCGILWLVIALYIFVGYTFYTIATWLFAYVSAT